MDDTTTGVFSPGRLRAIRDLCKLNRHQLATLAGLPAATVAAYEQGDQPEPDHITALADALNVAVTDLHGPSDTNDSWEYWGVICAAMPPMTPEQIATVASVLRRIEKHRQHGETLPDAASPPIPRPRTG